MPPLSRRRMLGLATAAAFLAGCSHAVRGAAAPSQQAASRAGTAAQGNPRATVIESTPSPASPDAGATHPPSQPPSTGPAVEVLHGRRNRPEVALTFHGAGEPSLARELLQLLAKRHTVGTVMVVGSWLAANPSMAAAIAAGGHDFGNHTWTHPTLSELDEAAVHSEVQRCRDTLVALTGAPGIAFRQSAAQYSTPLIRDVAGSLGYRTCLSYDVDSLDWTDPSVRIVRQSAAAATAGSVISLHLGHRVTIDALPAILDDLAARNLTPVSASRLLRI